MSTWLSLFELCTQSTTSSLWIKPHLTRFAGLLSSCLECLSPAIECLSNTFQSHSEDVTNRFLYAFIVCVRCYIVFMQSTYQSKGSSCSGNCSICDHFEYQYPLAYMWFSQISKTCNYKYLQASSCECFSVRFPWLLPASQWETQSLFFFKGIYLYSTLFI